MVWAYNDTTHSYAKKQVINVFTHVRDSIYQVHIGKEIINTTSDHPFFIGGRWLTVTNLKVGDSVVTYTGKKIAITAINIVAKQTIVYNFEVADYHTYYVSPQQVLVHNNGACDVDLLKNLEKGKLNQTVETATDAKKLLKDGRGNLPRYKNYTYNKYKYKKGYEVHNQRNAREAVHKLQHIKWRDGQASGHIFYRKPN